MKIDTIKIKIEFEGYDDISNKLKHICDLLNQIKNNNNNNNNNLDIKEMNILQKKALKLSNCTEKEKTCLDCEYYRYNAFRFEGFCSKKSNELESIKICDLFEQVVIRL